MALRLLPLPRMRNGATLALAKLQFYETGTTTPLATYSNSDGDVSHLNTNPVVADADGLFGPIYILPQSYTVVLLTATDVPVYTQDDVFGPNFDSDLATDALEITGNQSLSAVPIGNGFLAYSSFVLNATTVKTVNAEWIAQINVINNKGSGLGAPTGDKVAFFSGIEAQSGSGSSFAANFVAQADSGAGTGSLVGLEIDMNNNATDASGAPTYPYFAGLLFSGAGTKHTHGAIIISGAADIWDRGIYIDTTNPVRLYSFEDNGHSIKSILIAGSHTHGIDMGSGSFSTAAMALPNNTPVIAKDSGAADRNLITMDASNYVVLGYSGGGWKFGTHSSLSGETVSGYITIKDIGGNTRKLAVVS